jgi:hypothetical protein
MSDWARFRLMRREKSQKCMKLTWNHRTKQNTIRRMVFQSMMTVEEFKALPSPEKLSPPLQALWHDARGDWNRAHDLVQQSTGRAGDRVHAYLHRKEGDEGNARYWYHRIGVVKPSHSLDEEWLSLVKEFLNA